MKTVDELAKEEQYFSSLAEEIADPRFFHTEDKFGVMAFEKERYFMRLSQATFKGIDAFCEFIKSGQEVINCFYYSELLSLPPLSLKFVHSYVKLELVRKACQALSEERQ